MWSPYPRERHLPVRLLLIHATPLLVEAGILLDVTVGVFVIGIIVDRIQRAFDTLDTRKLTVLRE